MHVHITAHRTRTWAIIVAVVTNLKDFSRSQEAVPLKSGNISVAMKDRDVITTDH